MPKSSATKRWTTFQFRLADGMLPVVGSAALPLVWGTRSNACALGEAVDPRAGSSRTYQYSRSRGVGAGIIRQRKSLASISHSWRNLSTPVAPVNNPSRPMAWANQILPNLPLIPAFFVLALVELASRKAQGQRFSAIVGEDLYTDMPRMSCIEPSV